jgi:hypothetical protein
MQLSDAPVQIQLPFANGDGSKTNPVPVPSQISITPGAASFTDGFPPLCATPVSSGGIPPSKADMDGILFMLSGLDRWGSAGAGFPFSSVYATAIGGYPKGARVLNAAGSDYWLNTLDNNSTNPDTGSVPTGWIPTKATASVYASAQQTLATGNSKILWDTVEFDYYGLWNAANKQFVAPWAGKYRFSGSVYLPAPAAQNFSLQIYKHGFLAKVCSEFPQVSNVDLTLSFSAIISLAVNDYLEAYLNVTQSSVLAGPNSGSAETSVYGQIEFVGE